MKRERESERVRERERERERGADQPIDGHADRQTERK